MEWRKRYRKFEFRDKIESVQLGLKRIVSDLPLGLAVVDENRDLLFLSSMPIRNLEKGAEAGLHQYPPMPRKSWSWLYPSSVPGGLECEWLNEFIRKTGAWQEKRTDEPYDRLMERIDSHSTGLEIRFSQAAGKELQSLSLQSESGAEPSGWKQGSSNLECDSSVSIESSRAKRRQRVSSIWTSRIGGPSSYASKSLWSRSPYLLTYSSI